MSHFAAFLLGIASSYFWILYTYNGTKNAQTIETADVVYHRPTGKQFVVVYVRNGRVAPYGPLPHAVEIKTNECVICLKADKRTRESFLRNLAQSHEYKGDFRQDFALRELKRGYRR